MTDVVATAPDARPAEQEDRLDLDGLGPAFVNDPHPVLAAVRAEQPVRRVSLDGYIADRPGPPARPEHHRRSTGHASALPDTQALTSAAAADLPTTVAEGPSMTDRHR